MNRTAVSQGVSRAMFIVCCACAGLMVAVLATVLFFVVAKGLGALSWGLFTKDVIAEGLPGYPGGLRHAIGGTLVLLGLASAVGVPMGMMVGVFLSEYAAESRLAGPVRFVADVLAGVPSIVVGILGYELLVVPFATGRMAGVPVPFMQKLGGSGGSTRMPGRWRWRSS